MLKAMWSSLVALVMLWTLVWVLKSNATGVGIIAGIILVASLGYLIIIFFVIFTIYFIIKWAMQKYG